jgi:hypothetical protein
LRADVLAAQCNTQQQHNVQHSAIHSSNTMYSTVQYTAATQCTYQTTPTSFMAFWILAQTFIGFRDFIVPVCYTAFVNNT